MRPILTDIMLIVLILFPQMCKEFNFSFCLHEKGFLGLDNFNRHLALGLNVFGSHDLSKGSFPNAFLDAVSSVKQLPGCDNVIIIFVVPSIVVGAASFAFFFTFSACIPFLVVDGINVFVGINETDGQFDQGSIRG